MEVAVGNERLSAEDLHGVLEAEVREMTTATDWATRLEVAALFPAFGAAGQNYTLGGKVDQQVNGFRVGVVYDVTDTVGPPIHLPHPAAPGNRTVLIGVWDALASEATADDFPTAYDRRAMHLRSSLNTRAVRS
ncbi:hypothetical protein [Kribbella sp. NBC_00359]|uniref:hypothetical protein n=1 Tax=Kribbella sp. NBC_00359 TaxID=2975966 RepID=UPI002E20CE0D